MSVRMTPQEKRRFRAEQKVLKKRWRSGAIGHTLLTIFTLIMAVALAVVILVERVFLGPSPTAGDLLTNTLLETSALKFIPYIFYRDEVVDRIVARNSVIEPEESTDTSMITIADIPTETSEEYKDIEIVDIKGSTYKGVMMIVKDPSRVFVGVCADTFSASTPGILVSEFSEKYDAVGVINGGAFYDPAGGGTGGMPLGLVYSQGKMLIKPNDSVATAMGFDQDNVLHVGKFTVEEAQELGLRDAVAYGPALIVNGEPVVASGSGSGMNPRSAIGQRADGAVLLLVIDGRRASSLGATIADLIDIMMEYGAVNAGNLDGGSSSVMYYEGKQLNEGVSITGSRGIPTAWIVK